MCVGKSVRVQADSKYSNVYAKLKRQECPRQSCGRREKVGDLHAQLSRLLPSFCQFRQSDVGVKIEKTDAYKGEKRSHMHLFTGFLTTLALQVSGKDAGLHSPGVGR